MSTVIEVDIWRVRVHAPADLDPADEDAVNAWVAANHDKVRAAAQEDAGVSFVVSNAWQAES